MEEEKFDRILLRWIELSDEDLDHAKIMLDHQKLLMSVFFLQQTIEKILKAYFHFLKKNDPPFTHNLILLSEETEMKKLLSKKQNQIFAELNPYYIATRYPTFREKLKIDLNEEKVHDFFKQTKEVLKCLKQEMKQKK